jgi:EAL domain-containing protein (putative c-di-GMP-specific phosphodiesterase class I)
VAIAFGYAKRVESKDFVYFDENIRKELYQEMLIRKMLPKALENDEFLVFYQPKVSLDTYKLSGAEALVRWKQNGRIIPPVQFIPICEKNGFVKQIDFYVLDQICKKIRAWLDEGLEIVKISSNFSKHHFEEKNIADKICGIVDKWNVPHEYIEVEFTETAYIDRQDILSETIEKLKSYGFSSSMDDFGSGYSSLSLLQALNFDVLKLDKSLLGRGVNDIRTNKIIANVIAMTKDLNMEIIAEGVETRQELEMLHRLNCNVVQGYIFDKPLTEEEFYKRLLNKEYRI